MALRALDPSGGTLPIHAGWYKAGRCVVVLRETAELAARRRAPLVSHADEVDRRLARGPLARNSVTIDRERPARPAARGVVVMLALCIVELCPDELGAFDVRDQSVARDGHPRDL